ncbi:bifunctional diaminohydroxyphosphoribosylaminopyrimidine deaminase/5-amino-6-(5-phosphoribosylamino)uracil reductase RibD [Candidatus Poriferisodalis sp.]|uniref:bifunctional diaminohydroxyphosphoribosylaminopyrimidine deaminase/5-amino-6-(5-phosphoribosylamino)uracil reductase RibD n=1 Tax=Candidatus Poriferisodalis sp. TaxID=3101277 RepID=UPI003B521FA0
MSDRRSRRGAASVPGASGNPSGSNADAAIADALGLDDRPGTAQQANEAAVAPSETPDDRFLDDHDDEKSHVSAMLRAVCLGESVRGTTAPNPWVGAVLVTADGDEFEGATEPPPGRHAEIVALDAARESGADLAQATLYTTLEPCSHTGRTPPCVEAIIDARIARVCIGVADPDPNVSGRGTLALRSAGIEVIEGLGDVVASLGPYLHQRRTDKPWVVLKLAATLDGRIGAPDGTSQWITSAEARADAHALRARCDAVLIGAGTVRADNPSLTVRDAPGTDPRRFVLGSAPSDAKVHPCTEVSGPLPAVLEDLAAEGVVELLVEGGAHVAGEFHRSGLVDEYVVYLAPALAGGADSLPMLAGLGAPTLAEFWRGHISEFHRVGPDLRITLRPVEHCDGPPASTVASDGRSDSQAH